MTGHLRLLMKNADMKKETENFISVSSGGIPSSSSLGRAGGFLTVIVMHLSGVS